MPSSIYDLKSPADGVVVSVPQSKTDQESAEREVGLSLGTSQHTCPVRSLRQRLAASGISEGLVFRSVGRYGHVAQPCLHRDSIEKLLKGAAARAEIDVRPPGWPSLRAGCVASTSWESVASTIPTTHEDFGRSVQTRKCENRLGHPGFAYLHGSVRLNPLELLMEALDSDDQDSRVTEALAWLLLAYPHLNWD